MPEKDQEPRRPEDRDAPGRPVQARVSRRSLLGAAGVGAAGLAAGAFATPAFAAVTKPQAARQEAARQDDGPGVVPADEPVFIHVANAHTGELDVYAGTSHTKLHNPALAAQLRRAAR